MFEAGDVVLVVETDKIAYDVEAPAPGILHEVLVSEGGAVPVGTPIGRWDIGDIKVSLDAPNAETPAQPVTARHDVPAAKPVAAEVPVAGQRRPIATPYARRLARLAGIDLRRVNGTGPRGRIKAADVNREIEAQPSNTAPVAQLPVAEGTEPVFHIAAADVDVTSLCALNEQINHDLPELRTELVHYVVLAASRISDILGEQPVMALAPARGAPATGSVVLFGKDDCRSLRAIVAHTEHGLAKTENAALGGTLWVERALDGVSFFSSAPPRGWSASINIGSVRQTFRPDNDGRPVRAAVATVVLAVRVGAFDPNATQELLCRMRALLESPLLLLAS